VLEERVGAGGMGEVFRGRDRTTGRVVAIKVLDAFETDDYERFRREASALASLQHDAIVRYVAHGQLAERAFLAMEWLEGESLDEHVRHGGLTLGAAIAIGRRLASALAAAHERGIVHRDVKPSNVFLRDAEPARATLIDFGIARRAFTESTLTGTGMVIGTPGYMSPEQARASEWIDARADVFALGCVLYKCLTGRRPFRGNDPLALLTKTLLSEPPRPRQLLARVPLELDALVMRMLAKDPRDRPGDAAEVLETLERMDAFDAVDVSPTSAAYPLLTRAERRLASVLLIGPGPGVVTSGPPSRHADWPRWTAAARTHGVQLEPLASGSIVALLTAEAAGDDFALRIARAACALRGLVRDAPMVVVTGRGLVAAHGAGNEVVDRAARALAELPAGQANDGIWVDRVSATLLSARFEIDKSPLGHLLRSERPREDRAGPHGETPPLVGRERELAELESIWIDCVRKRSARGVVVTGAAGVGKSRLVRELVTRAQRGDATREIWRGRADGARIGSPFALLGDALSQGLDLSKELEPDRRLARLARRVTEIAPAADAERLVAFVGELAGLAPPAAPGTLLERARRDPALLGEQMLRAFIDLVLAVARKEPLLLVLEDVQWADGPSLAFVERALNRAFDAPLCAVAIARTDDAEAFDELWNGDFRSVIRLTGLPRTKSVELLRRTLGRTLDTARMERIAARADGNPFVLEALARAAVEGHDEIPETALALVEARLERLTVETRRVLRAASIFGESFFSPGVQALVDDISIDGAVAELVELGFVAPVTPSRLFSHPELRFRHSLIREAAYASLTAEDRRLGHELAASWLANAGETDPWPIAEHHRLAGQSKLAGALYRDAARAALAANAFGAVLERVDRAFACIEQAGETNTPPAGEFGELWLMTAEARRWMGDPRAAADAAEQAIACFEPGETRWFRAIGELSSAAGRLGEYDRMAQALDRAARVPTATGERSAQIAALCPGAAQLLQAGRTGGAERLYAAIESLASDELLDAVAEARLHQLRGFHWLHCGEPWHAIEYFSLASQRFVALGRSRNAAIESINLAHAGLEAGRLDVAERALSEALATGELLGLSAVRTYANLNLGRLHFERGELDLAERAEARALTLGMRERSPRAIGAARVHLGAIALARGEPALAEAEALAAIDLLAVAPPLQAGAHAVLARALTAQNQAARAVPSAERALEMVDSGQHDIFDALVRVAYVETMFEAGEQDRATFAVERASEALLARAARIPNEAERQAFLTNVSLHARTLELARQLGVLV
jgi:tetratricopeptide (TPR) repeat protein